MFSYKNFLKKFFGICMIAMTSTSFSQSPEDVIKERYQSYWYNNPLEIAFIDADKKIYFSGENLRFSCVIFNHFLEPSGVLSKIFYVSLIGENGEYYSYAFKNENGLINDSIELPTDIPTGNYQLLAHSRFMKNFDFDYYSHRIPVYIQNLSDESKKVVKTIKRTREFGEIITENSSSSLFEVSEVNDRLIVRINNNDRVLSGDYYLISEGFNSVQFITRISIRKKEASLAIPLNILKGRFQKFALVDNSIQVVGGFAYSLEPEAPNDYELVINRAVMASAKEDIQLSVPDNLVTLILGEKSLLKGDSIALLKRVYRHFYNVPNHISLDSYSFKELFSKEVLNSFSQYVGDKWQSILSERNEADSIVYNPEKELTLYGKITGDLELLPPNATIDVHLFKNSINIFSDIEEDGTFRIGMFSWTTTDLIYASVLDENKKDLSPNYNIELYSEKVPYNHNVEFYEREKTDQIIASQQGIKYALSTFKEFPPREKFLWEKKIYDEIVRVDDYRDLDSTEQFVREVLSKVTVTLENGRHSFRMFSPDEGKVFDNAPFMMIDNAITEDAEEIFAIPLSQIEDIRMLYHLNRLENFGSPFVNGVLIIKTHDEEYTNNYTKNSKRLVDFYGFQKKSENTSVHNFDQTLFSDLIRIPKSNTQYDVGKDLGDYNVRLEILTKNGKYFYTNESLNVIYK